MSSTSEFRIYRSGYRTGAAALLMLFAVVALWQCVPAEDSVEAPAFKLDMTNAAQQKVLDFQDRLLTDSLTPYFTSIDPSLRYRAAMAFASLKDSMAIHQLSGLLQDGNSNVRMAAAYALGQTGSVQAEDLLIQNFMAFDSTGQFEQSNAAILEAVGKTGSPKSLELLSTIETYQLEDSVLILGQARGIYRFALRGITSDQGTAAMVDLLATTQLPQSVRVMAANYLLRAENIDVKPHLPTLIPMFENDPDARIRMCLAVAIGKSSDAQALRVLQRRFPRENEYRVQCNILKALPYFTYAQSKEFAFGAIQSKNLHVARTAAQYFVDHGIQQEALRYRAVARAPLPWEVKSVIYQASNRHLPPYYAITKSNINAELGEWLRRSKNHYESAAIIRALGEDGRNYTSIHQQGFQADHPVVRTAACETLVAIVSATGFRETFGGQANRVRGQIAGYFAEAVASGDVAMIATGAEGLSHATMKGVATQHMTTLETALAKIPLPEGIESYNALASCIAEIKGEAFQPKIPDYTHPADWTRIAALRDTVIAEVITSKGTLRLHLDSRHAPATVLNFVQLAKDQFFNGKNFHRVVPNFVIQGGCTRGDGYGSLDYAIRSELAPAYYDRGGYVGMASAGNHTECTQWFVTHSPTPHLDGNYTIFGRVAEGMSVVHDIQPGDTITEINILN